MTTNDTTTAHTVWKLARLADISSPDSSTSPGAKWLEQVASCIDDYTITINDQDDALEDRIHEDADQMIPIYTNEKWTVFVDLAAYQEDVSDYGPLADINEAASYALYQIAMRLLDALVTERREQLEDGTDIA